MRKAEKKEHAAFKHPAAWSVSLALLLCNVSLALTSYLAQLEFEKSTRVYKEGLSLVGFMKDFEPQTCFFNEMRGSLHLVNSTLRQLSTILVENNNPTSLNHFQEVDFE